MSTLLERIARSASRSWRRSLAIAAVVLVALGVLAGTVGGQFTNEFAVPGTESQKALDLLQDRFPAAANEGATVVFYADRAAFETASVRRRSRRRGARSRRSRM